MTVLDSSLTVWLPPHFPEADGRVVELTPRQADVLTGICHGLSNEQIGRRLYISEETVRTHVKRLFRKLRVHDRCHAASLAHQITVVVRGDIRDWTVQ